MGVCQRRVLGAQNNPSSLCMKEGKGEKWHLDPKTLCPHLKALLARETLLFPDADPARCSPIYSPPFQGRQNPWPSIPRCLHCSLPIKAILVKNVMDFISSCWIFGLWVLTMAPLSCWCHCQGCPGGTPSLPPAGTINTPPSGLKIAPCPLLAVIGNLAAPNPVVSAFLCPSLYSNLE